MNVDAHIRARLAGVPPKPGVYLMRDAKNRIIYVGKAILLRNRLRSYFQKSASHTPKTQRLVGDVADLEWIVTKSELEALILECELIKRHRPRYNVRFKDDKRYPFIKISVEEDFPRVYVVRKMGRDGSRYFGPFTSAHTVHESLETLRRLFPYRTCNREITGEDRRACLYYDIKRCLGPCIGCADREEYRAMIERVCLFLEGEQEEIIRRLQGDMQVQADALEFERAAMLRDQIATISRIIERQRVVSGHLHDHDFVALAREGGHVCVQVFLVRRGRLVGREYFVLTGAQDEAESEVAASFVKQFYDEAAHVPPEILVQNELDDSAVIERWLCRKRGAKVKIRVPKRGRKRAVMDMAMENATETLKRLRAEWEADTNKHTEALAEIQKALELPIPPARIECYDISNTQGTAATGSMVVFAKGVPSKRDYRRFRIKTVQGANDVESMAEVLRRRFSRARQSDGARSPDGKENRWALMPDLVIVDGGKGQLNAAREAMEVMGVQHIATAALAKQDEALHVPGRRAPVILPRDSQGLYLLQRIRDEAHRFAISYHRRLREKQGTTSLLDQVPGIGPRRRRALLEKFGSLDAIRQATAEELAAVPGMNRRAAEQLAEYL